MHRRGRHLPTRSPPLERARRVPHRRAHDAARPCRRGWAPRRRSCRGWCPVAR